MATKKLNIKFNYQSKVINSFVIITLLLYVLDVVVFKNKLNSSILPCPTNSSGNMQFSYFRYYLKLFIYVFGATDKLILFTNLLFIILLGPQMEEQYGSVMIGIMMFISAIFAGVLNACFCKEPMLGADPIIFMLIILDVLLCCKKKTINCTTFLLVIIFICVQVFRNSSNGAVGNIIVIAGGLCGSLFAFLALPRVKVQRNTTKVETRKPVKSSSTSTYKSRTDRIMEQNAKNEKQSKKKAPSDDDATIVGTLRF